MRGVYLSIYLSIYLSTLEESLRRSQQYLCFDFCDICFARMLTCVFVLCYFVVQIFDCACVRACVRACVCVCVCVITVYDPENVQEG